jgi:DNA mismatch repair ATPase MutS
LKNCLFAFENFIFCIYKQVAVIAYLAHIGSFVPANRAKIGVLHHIHTRIQTVESVATNVSAFMIDMKQVCKWYISPYNRL